MINENEEKSKSRYINAVNELSKSSSKYIDKLTKEDYDTKYAIAYLVDNLDFIKLQSQDSYSGRRNYIITDHVMNIFPNCNKDKIVAFLNRKRILTNELFFIFNIALIMILNIIIYLTIKNKVYDIESYVIITIFVSAFSCLILQLAYAEGKTLRLYRINLKKIKKNE